MQFLKFKLKKIYNPVYLGWIFFIKIILILFLKNEVYPQEYTIIVRAKKNQENSKEDVIKIEKENYTTLTNVLEKETGFLIQKYGGEGSYSLLRIRGSNANQVNLYLDGIPLNFASYSEVNLSDLQLFNYGTIEIEKNGNQTGLVGSSIGGSLNLIPELILDKNQIYIIGGSFHTAGIGIQYQQLYKKNHVIEYQDPSLSSIEEKSLSLKPEDYQGGWNISLYRETSDQNFLFKNHNGTIYFNTIDDYNDKRKNSWYKKNSSLINGFFNIASTQIRILNDTFYRYHGIPGPITRQTEKTKREHLRNTTGFFTDTKHLFIENFRLQSRVYYTYINNNFKDPKSELAFGANSSKAFLHNKGIQLLPQFIFPMPIVEGIYKINLLFGCEQEFFFENRYTNTGLKTGELPEKKRFHYSYHFSNQFLFFNEFIEFIPEIRYEEFRNNFYIETNTKQYLSIEELKKDESKIHFINDSFKIKINPYKKENIYYSIFLEYNQEKRIPSFIELFGEKGSIVPNLKLRPEISYNLEGGFLIRYYNFFLDIRAYKKEIKDLIQFIPNSQFSLRAENIEKAKIKGAEISSKYKLEKLLHISVSYSYQEAIQLQKDNVIKKQNYIPLIPLHTVKSSINLNPEQKWEYQIDVFYYGAFFKNKSNDYFSYQPPKWIYNFTFYFRPWNNFVSFIEVQNIQNRLYEDIIGYSLPGRNFVIGMRYYF